MPKKKNPETPEEQSERFRRDAQKLIDDGALDPTEGEKGLEGLVKRARFDGR